MENTSFLEIYRLAITEIEDPIITRKFEESVIDFARVMYNYLDDAIPFFTSPQFVMDKLYPYNKPSYDVLYITGNGVDSEFLLERPFTEDTLIEVKVEEDNVNIETTQYEFDKPHLVTVSYDKDNETLEFDSTEGERPNDARLGFDISLEKSSIIFESPPKENSKITVRFYDIGSFNFELNPVEKSILAEILVYRWATKEQNYLLDIRRLLRDDDYQLHDGSRTVNSKLEWTTTMRERYEKRMMKYDYDCAYKHYGNRLWNGGGLR